MGLFKLGEFVSHSDEILKWKIECDALDDEDLKCIAWLIFKTVGDFGSVEGVPTGGLRLAYHMKFYVSKGPLLIVDDVLTTGNSMEEHRNRRFAKGAVIFARSAPPFWVDPVFSMGC